MFGNTQFATKLDNTIIFGEIGMGREPVAREIYEHSSRTQKPIIVIEAGGAPHIGKHDPKSGRSETYNRIKGYFTNADGGTIILKLHYVLPNFFGLKKTNLGLSNSSEFFCI